MSKDVDHSRVLLVQEGQYVPMNMIVGLFSTSHSNIQNLVTSLTKKGKLLDLVHPNTESTKINTLILLKNGLGVLTTTSAQQLQKNLVIDPYPELLASFLEILQERLD